MNFSFLFLILIVICLITNINAQIVGDETASIDEGISGETVNEIETASEIPSRLLESAGNGDIEGIEEAIHLGEDLSSTNVNGWSAAMFAVAGGHINALNSLIRAGIDINLATVDGVTPLMLAALQGDKEIVEMLLDNEADPSLVAEDSTTAYSIAVSTGRNIVALLIAEASVAHGIITDNEALIIDNIERGAYVDVRTRSGWTALMQASSNGNVALVKTLLEKKADANKQENDGWAPLHFAAHNGHGEVVELLLEAGAHPYFLNANEDTAGKLAEDAGFADLAEKLRVNDNGEEL